MAKYVFAYRGGNGVAPDEAERNAQMAKWGQWFGELGSAVVDGGAASGTAKTVGPGGAVDVYEAIGTVRLAPVSDRQSEGRADFGCEKRRQ